MAHWRRYAVLLLVISVALWVGAALRLPRLRHLIPSRARRA